MVITRMKIGKKDYYSVNGYHVRVDAMDAIGEEIFTPDGWAIIAKHVATLGYAICNVCTDGITPDDIKRALAAANAKTAKLEKRIAHLLKGE